MAGDLQNRHPNPCRHASSGYFGSKFTTLCVTGNEQHEVEIRGYQVGVAILWIWLSCLYQVSNQCMALVRDDCLVPTLDAKELGYIRESTPQQYVPDVFYKVCVGVSSSLVFVTCCLLLRPKESMGQMLHWRLDLCPWNTLSLS